ncbi:hypothetical protein [Caldalkalibacillus salinus]|nr:hypothetical protein [Caldalkalibacillus salinus]
MKWEEIRNQYPDSWVLVEALKDESKDNRREIEGMSVISEFNNSVEAC